jgi:Flp pilus assembly protein TadD
MKGLSIPVLLLALAVVPASAATTPEANQLITQAQDAQVKGDHDLAVRLAQAAIVADPTRPEPYVALGEIYARQGQAEFARAYFDAALEVDPQDAAAQRGIAALANPAKAAAATP